MKGKPTSRAAAKESEVTAPGARAYEKITAVASSSIPKYRQVYEDLHSAIRTGAFQPGERLPSEAELGEHYNTSRITVAKALNELQLQGLVSRRAGSGTHVLAPAISSGHVF
jgi:GntR family transcriptional regulator of arabinose operon